MKLITINPVKAMQTMSSKYKHPFFLTNKWSETRRRTNLERRAATDKKEREGTIDNSVFSGTFARSNICLDETFTSWNILAYGYA